MPTVRSSAILSVDYDPLHRELSITFRSGQTYKYSPVPPAVYQGLLNAPSIGSYYNENIKDRYSEV